MPAILRVQGALRANVQGWPRRRASPLLFNESMSKRGLRGAALRRREFAPLTLPETRQSRLRPRNCDRPGSESVMLRSFLFVDHQLRAAEYLSGQLLKPVGRDPGSSIEPSAQDVALRAATRPPTPPSAPPSRPRRAVAAASLIAATAPGIFSISSSAGPFGWRFWRKPIT